MAKAGRRYPLVIYTRMIDRWWPAIFLLGLATMALAWPFYQDQYTRLTEPWRWMTMAGVGAGVILISLFMLMMRKSAYVQPFSDHLLLATPIFRLNISYRRVQRTSTAVMATLFPPRSMHGMKRDIIEPLTGMTAVVIDLNAYPVSRSVLSIFLSSFFFKDKTPHLVLLVQNWMGFSTEIESMRTSGNQSIHQQSTNQSILSRLPRK